LNQAKLGVFLYITEKSANFQKIKVFFKDSALLVVLKQKNLGIYFQIE